MQMFPFTRKCAYANRITRTTTLLERRVRREGNLCVRRQVAFIRAENKTIGTGRQSRQKSRVPGQCKSVKKCERTCNLALYVRHRHGGRRLVLLVQCQPERQTLGCDDTRKHDQAQAHEKRTWPLKKAIEVHSTWSCFTAAENTKRGFRRLRYSPALACGHRQTRSRQPIFKRMRTGPLRFSGNGGRSRVCCYRHNALRFATLSFASKAPHRLRSPYVSSTRLCK